MSRKLTGVPETLLIPLVERAVETKEPEPIIRDKKAIDIISRIDYDFSSLEKDWILQIGVAVRTKLLDDATRAFLQQYPDAVVVNLGAGLSTHFVRLDNGRVRWYDLDLPEVIELRRSFFTETERYSFISGSLFDFSWLDDIDRSQGPVLFIAEGLLYYFEEKEVKMLLRTLAESFPGAEMLFEMLGYKLIGKYHRSAGRHLSGDGDVEFRWALKDTRDIEMWNSRLRFVEEWRCCDYYRSRWRWLGLLYRLVPPLRTMASSRIVHLRFL